MREVGWRPLAKFGTGSECTRKRVYCRDGGRDVQYERECSCEKESKGKNEKAERDGEKERERESTRRLMTSTGLFLARSSEPAQPESPPIHPLPRVEPKSAPLVAFLTLSLSLSFL